MLFFVEGHGGTVVDEIIVHERLHSVAVAFSSSTSTLLFVVVGLVAVVIGRR